MASSDYLVARCRRRRTLAACSAATLRACVAAAGEARAPPVPSTSVGATPRRGRWACAAGAAERRPRRAPPPAPARGAHLLPPRTADPRARRKVDLARRARGLPVEPLPPPPDCALRPRADIGSPPRRARLARAFRCARASRPPTRPPTPQADSHVTITPHVSAIISQRRRQALRGQHAASPPRPAALRVDFAKGY